MSETLGSAGAVLLGAATLPQAIRLARTRSAREFHAAFAALNLAGLVLLAIRSAGLGERSFLAINLVGAAFWLAILVVKAVDARPRVHNKSQVSMNRSS